MASKKPATKVSGKHKMDTKWLNNAMKSIGAATAANFKDIMPYTYKAGSEVGFTARDVYKTANTKGRSALGNLNNIIAGNKYVKMAKKALDQSIEDVKSGNLYNENRASESFGGGFDDFSDDIDSMFGDFDSDEESGGVTLNYVEASDDRGNSMVADAIAKSSEANIKASKASVDAMIAVTGASLSQQVEMLGRLDAGIETANNTLTAILQYHEENTTNFYETVTAALEQIGKKQEDSFGRESSYDKTENLFTSDGGLDMAEYKKYIKKNAKRAVDNSPVGMLLPFLKDDDMIEMLISDPVGGITKGVIGGLIPSVISGTLKELDNTVSNLIPNMLANLSKSAKSQDASSLLRTIGSIFGINVDKRTNVDLEDRFDKSAATFDDVTRNSIVEVLPKYARESTAYLRAIAMHVTKQKDSDILGKAQVFDLKTSTYKDQDQLNKDIAESLESSISEAFKSVDFGKMLEAVGENLDSKSKDSYNKALNQLFVQLSEFGDLDVRDFNLKNKNSAANQALNSVTAKGGLGKQSKALLEEAIRYMYENNIGVDSAAVGHSKAKIAYSKKVEEMEADPEFSNLIAAGITNKTDLAEFVDKYTGNTQAMKIRQQLKDADARDLRQTDKGIARHNRKLSNAELAANGINDFVDVKKARQARDDSRGWISDKLIGEGLENNIRTAGGHMKDSLWALMKGDTKGVLENINAMFTDIAGEAWKATSENFFKPLGKKIFGEKDENGISQAGLLSGATNKVNDTWKAFLQKINGKDYKDSNGEVHHLDDDSGTLVGKVSTIFTEVKDSISFHLFGEKDPDKKKDKNSPGIIESMITSLKEGINGWSNILFGTEDDPDHKIDMKKIKDGVLDAMPDALLGAGAGTIFGAMSGGSLLGTLIGGPVGGAVIGMAGGLLSRSDKFKDWLFGEEIDDGEGGKQRIGGFISKGAQDFLSNNSKSIIGGAAVGAIKSIVFPSSTGLLTSIVGGPVAGAAVGAAWGLIKQSDAFKTFLFGNEEEGKQGVVNAFKGIFKGNSGEGKDGKDNKNILKSLGMGAIGAVGGGLTASLVGKVGLLGAMVTPGGPLGAAILGAAVGIGSASTGFRKWMFGEKDEETGKRKGGIVQKFGNYIQVEILHPLKSRAMDFFEDAATTIKYDVLENIRAPFVAVANSLKEKVEAGLKKVGDVGKFLAEHVTDKFIKPIGSLVNRFVVQPIKKVTSAVTGLIYGVGKRVITAPFKLVGWIYKRVTNKKGFIRRGIEGIFNFTKDRIKNVIGGIGKLALWLLKKGAGAVGTVAGAVKGVGQRIGDKIEARNPGLVRAYRDWKDQKQIDRNGDDENAQSFYQSRKDARSAKEQNRVNRRDRKNLDKNRAMMAKILGYDEKYFTEETMALAEEKAGHKINWHGTAENMKFDQTPEQKRAELLKKSREQILSQGATSTDPEIRQLNEQMQTNKKLDSIWKVLYDSYLELKGEGFSDEEIADSLGEQRDQLAEAEKKNHMVREDRKNHGGAYKDLPKDNNELLEQVKEKNWGDRAGDEIEDSFNSASDSMAERVRKEGLKGIFKGFGRARAEGGPVDKDKAYLVGDGGKDPEAAEIFVPKESGKILSQENGGIKVQVEGFSTKVLNKLRSFFGKTKTKADEDSERIKVDMMREDNEINETRSKGTYSEIETKKREAEAQADRDETQKGILASLKTIGKGNEKHHTLFDTLYNIKKGLLAVGLVSLVPFIVKNLPTIWSVVQTIGSAVGTVASWLSTLFTNLSNQFGWNQENNALDDGNTTAEQIEKEGERTEEVLSDLAHGNVVGAAADYVLDDGTYDAQSGARAKLLLHGGVGATKVGVKAAEKTKKLLASGEAKTLGSSIKNGAKNVKTWFTDANDIASIAAESGDEFYDLASGSFQKTTAKGINKVKSGLNKLGKPFEKSAYQSATGNIAKTGTTILDDGTKAISASSWEKMTQGLSETEKNLMAYQDGWTVLDDSEGIGRKILNTKAGQKVTEVASGVKTKAGNVVSSVKSKFGKTAAESTDDVIKSVGKVTTESVDDVVKAADSKGATKVISMVKEFFSTLISKVTKKLGKDSAKEAAEKGTKSLLKQVTECVSTKFSKIASKVTSIITGKTTLGIITLDTSEIIFFTIGALNGLGKGAAARLFQVDQDAVDATMRAISAAIGGFTGTMVGSVVDVVCGLVSDVLGIDLLNALACTLYKIFAGEDKYDDLTSAQDTYKDEYLEYQDAELQKNYETQQKLGNVGADVSYEDYVSGVQDGTYSATYQGFDDWNADQNQSLGSKIGKGATTAWKTIKSGVAGNVSYTDESTGYTYKDIGDNKYMAYDADGNEIGEVAKSSVDVSNMTKSRKGGIAGAAISAGKAIGSGLSTVGKGIAGVASTAWGGIKSFGGKAVDKGKEIVGGIADGVTGVFQSIGDSVTSFIDKVKEVGTALKTGQDTIANNFYNTDMDFGQYLSADVNTLSEDNPMHGLVGAVLNGAKVVDFIPFVIAGIARRIGKSVAGFVKSTFTTGVATLKDVGSQFSTINTLTKAGDVEGLHNLKYEPADETFGGIGKGLVGGMKMIHYPLAAVSWVGHKIGEGFTAVVNGVKTVFSKVSYYHSDLDTISKSGNFDRLNSFSYMSTDDSPLSGIAGGIVHIDTLMHYPSTALHWVGKKIGNFIGNQIDKAKTAITDIAPNIASIHDLSTSGDLDGLNSFEATISDDNPLAGISKGVIGINKFFAYPSTALHWVGNKVHDGIVSGVEKIKTAASATGESVSELNDFAKAGDTDSLLAYEPTIDDDVPAGGFLKGVIGIAKYVMVPSAYMHRIGNNIAEFMGNTIENAKDILTATKEYISTLTSYTDTDKDMSGFNKEEINTDSPVGKIIGAMIKKPIHMYVTIMRGINAIGDWFSDRAEDLGNVASNVADTASGALDTVTSGISSLGTNLMNLARGGSGIGRPIGGRGVEPETVNGYDYYSQNDSNWKNQAYVSKESNDGATMGDSGCGPTAMSMVVSQSMNSGVDPTSMAKLASNAGFRDNTGTNADFIDYAGDTYGLAHQDQLNPSAKDIKNQLQNGQAVILNGVSENSNGPYTDAGHYVVAVGLDSSGRVLVNDPRGKEYSKPYQASALAKGAAKSWAFNVGGNGRGFVPQIKYPKGTIGGRGVSGDWLSIVKSVKALVAAQKPKYDQGGTMYITYNGKKWKMRPDCSGLVGIMLQIYGAIPEGTNVTSSSLCSSGAISDGFTYGGWPGWDNLQEGDIITRHGHVEIFCRNENGTHYVYNGGSTDALCSAGATKTGHSQGYEVVWRPGDAGTGSNVVSTGDATVSTDSSSSSDDIASNVASVFSQLQSGALEVALGTKSVDDIDFTWGSSSSSSSTSTTDTSSSASDSYTAVGNDTTKNNIWSFFRKKGLSDIGIAGIMGNMQEESGFQANNLQNSYEKSLGYTDETYTKAVDNGTYNNFVKDGAGYGLVQFTYYTLKQGLLDYAKKHNLSVGSDDAQLNYIYNDQKGSTAWNAVNSASSPYEAAKQWMLKYEKPQNQGYSAYNARGTDAEALYKSRPSGGSGTGPKIASRNPLLNRGGFGKNNHGGFGIESSEFESFDTTNYGVSTDSITESSTNDEKIIALMETIVSVLKDIGADTSKIEDIQIDSSTSVNNGGNVVVTNNTDNSTTTTTTQASKSTSDSRNAKLSQQIARGY
jgi:hypothetical protein